MRAKMIDENEKVYFDLFFFNFLCVLNSFVLKKKKGNGFLMLLPGIAIPIDTDAGDSDDASSSN